MSGAVSVTGAVVVGLTVGAVVGFMFGQGARSSAPGAVSVDTVGNKLVVTVDGNLLLQGGLNALVGQ